MFRPLAILLVGLVGTLTAEAQSATPAALVGLRAVRVHVVVTADPPQPAPIDTTAIVRALTDRLRAHGWSVAPSTSTATPLLLTEVFVAGVLPGLQVVRYNVTLWESVRPERAPSRAILAATWRAIPPLHVLTKPGVASGAIARMVTALADSLNAARGPIRDD